MIPRMGILSWPPSPWPGKLLLLASVALLLGACLPAATPSPSPSSELPPSSGNLPISEGGAQKGPVPTDGRAEVGDGVTVSPGQAGGSAGSYSVVERTYQWVGIIVVSLLEGRHLELKRDCDEWVLLPPSEDVSRRLEDNAGNQVVIWGQVFTGPTIYIRQAIAVQSAFGPGDPMPMTLVAVPEYPCPGTPTPKPVPPLQPITLLPGDIAARGELVWEEGKPYLSTPEARIDLTIVPQRKGAPEETLPRAEMNGQALASLEVVAVGRWRLEASRLTLEARTVRPWPVALVTQDNCGSSVSLEGLEQGEIATRGGLLQEGPRFLLKMESGPVWVTLPSPPLMPSLQGMEIGVIGKWKVPTAGELYVAVRWQEPLFQPCPPPPTPEPPLDIRLGEIAAIGYPSWEDGQPYLETPSGSILLLIPADAGLPFLKPPATPDPGSPPGLVRPQVIAVGQWSLKGGQLIIAVRYLRAWLAPVTVEPLPVEPAPPHRGQGTIYGRVRIGPLCPVEPCPSPGPADLYSSRALVLRPEAGEPTYIKLNPDGSFKAMVDAGGYIVELTDCSFLGCRSSLPGKVTVTSQEATLLEIDIDTGIR